jgi:hypothetical protein
MVVTKMRKNGHWDNPARTPSVASRIQQNGASWYFAGMIRDAVCGVAQDFPLAVRNKGKRR